MILRFDEVGSDEHAMVGGKGANLGRMTHAGFTVPPGFTVTTEAHDAFLDGDSAAGRAVHLLDGADYDDHADITERCIRIRKEIMEASVPAEVAETIREAYRSLGDDIYVAVRSSGTAEDLAGASFAGLHDTYLDVRGADDVVAAVQACWASLFTDRAAAYRNNRGYDHAVARMGVVVQTMVVSEASGVMFTANPLTEANDEIVINSSWGLGEAVVQGMVNPDQITLHIDDLRVVDSHIATKTVQMIRNPEGKGAIELEVPAAQQNQPSLPPEMVTALGDLGRRVQHYYEGIPQDVEWAVAGGELFLLQSRPITGVNFAWDCDVDFFDRRPVREGTVWSRVLADDVWTGAITPLFYSHRGDAWMRCMRDTPVPLVSDEELGSLRVVKYFKGEAYMNADLESYHLKWATPAARPGMAVRLPADMQEAALAQPFSWFDYAKTLVKCKLIYPAVGAPYGWMKYVEYCIANRSDEFSGLRENDLAKLSDAALRRYIEGQIDLEQEWVERLTWPGLLFYVREMMIFLQQIVVNWYTGDRDALGAYTQLITGTERITATLREHTELHEISRAIKASARLSEDFANHRDEAFFATLADHEDGRALQGKLDAFLATSGHRGHSDRDVYFPRYRDDAGVLYRALEAHGKSDDDPLALHHLHNAKRAEVIADIEANLQTQSMGKLKLEAFRYVLTYVLRFLECRDDEREFVDRNTYSIRLGYQEVARRCRERGHFETDRDFWFLTSPELYAVLDGHYNKTLFAAKIKGRMHNFDRFNTKQYQPPKFVQHNRPYAEQAIEAGADGVLRGMPASPGTITGTARVITELSLIGRVNRGEILIAVSTDPGWTPVFALLSGVVTESGGLLSHSSCLAREYGFPAVQLEGALQRIPDGATITVNGDAGTVVIHSDGSEDTQDEAAPETVGAT